MHAQQAPRPTGRRRTTPQMIAALATRPATWEPARRGQALSALKRAATALGIPRRVVELVDYLVGRTREEDWTEGARPIAWPSNATLQDALDLGRSQVKTLIRVGLEHDLFVMDESPNGQRWGVRAGGHIVEAYGFDLSPLAARRAEFEAAARAHEERRREARRLRDRISAMRNRVLSLADAGTEAGAAGADWPGMAAEARRLAALRNGEHDPGRLTPILASLTALHAGAQAALALPAPVDTGPKGTLGRPSLTPTNHLPIAKANTKAGGGAKQPHAEQDKSSGPVNRDSPASVGSGGVPASGPASALRGFVVTPDFILRVAPAFRGWTRNARTGWGELEEAGWLVRSDLGISQHAWGQACVVLGRMEALTALAAISARHTAGKVRSPGGLLRRMVELHQRGALRLDRTLFGLAEGLDRHSAGTRPSTHGQAP